MCKRFRPNRLLLAVLVLSSACVVASVANPRPDCYSLNKDIQSSSSEDSLT
ncbi:hypothetical protein M758_4G113800 [Ceratodon purpureus]|nr:hypothetical protein M758_4G113800 [Ceratodon purpureus]